MFQDITGEKESERRGERERERGSERRRERTREEGVLHKENILPTFEYLASAKGTRDPHYANGAS